MFEPEDITIEMGPCTVELTEGLELCEEEGRGVFQGWCRRRDSGPTAPQMPFRVPDEELAEVVAATAVAGTLMRIERGQGVIGDFGQEGPALVLQVEVARVLK